MPQGVIKKLVPQRGFGFISGQHDDVFFHQSAVVGPRFEDLHEGQIVEYLLEEEEASAERGFGPRAVSVRQFRPGAAAGDCPASPSPLS